MANFTKEKHQFEEHVETIFNEKADALPKMSAIKEERIRTATDVFDQKVKDKIIYFDQAMNEIKHIHQKVNERAEENEAFQQEMDQSHQNARLMNDQLLITINLFNPINTKFLQHLVAIRNERASL